VVQKWGTPAEAVGSLNEPREHNERGVTFNEKWVYERPRGEPGVSRRVIYWRRYDLVASFLEFDNGESRSEDLADRLGKELVDRRYRSTG